MLDLDLAVADEALRRLEAARQARWWRFLVGLHCRYRGPMPDAETWAAWNEVCRC
jgi:hypothetical protein